jgi:hypothetical protein
MMVAALFAAASTAEVTAQAGTLAVLTLAESAAPVPFGPGERATYRVTYGLFGTVGEGTVQVAGVDTVRGHPVYHLSFALKGGIPLARVDDKQESWLDVRDLYSHRFKQDIKEVKYKRLRTLDFFPEEGVYRWLERERTDTLAVKDPLDDISFMYWARTLRLEVGETYTFHRYFKESGNPVSVKVLRRDSVKVPAGTFRTIVLEPRIRTDGLFSEGGKAELHLTDDDRRMLVYMSVKLSIGTLKLHLKEYEPGTPLSSRRFSTGGRS